MSIIQNMLKKYFSNQETRILMVGMDAGGKTTMLYKLKLGEVVTTIPTIGFNVETVRYHGIDFIFWDVGGCDKIRPLWRHYFANTKAIFFVIDSNDRGRFEEFTIELHRLLAQDELKDALFLLVANKQDLPNSASLKEITESFKLDSIRSHQWYIQGTCAQSGDGLYECLDWVACVLKNGNGMRKIKPKNELAERKEEKIVERKDEKTLLEQWLERKDNTDDEFLKSLEDLSLEEWDHYTHLRIAWLYITRLGRKEGMKKIFFGIKNYIDKSGRTRKTFNETLTYFFCHMVHYAIATTNTPEKNFKVFLLMNPRLSSFEMLFEYYTKDLIFRSAKARAEVVLPNVKPLPSLISNIEQVEFKKVEDNIPGPKKASEDVKLIADFESRKLEGWSQETAIRLIWYYLTKLERRAGVKKIFEKFEWHYGKNYHLTQTYTLIQLTDLHLRQSLATTSLEFVREDKNKSLLNQLLWKEYYSEVVFESGIKEMKLPDKKPFPSLLPPATESKRGFVSRLFGAK